MDRVPPRPDLSKAKTRHSHFCACDECFDKPLELTESEAAGMAEIMSQPTREPNAKLLQGAEARAKLFKTNTYKLGSFATPCGKEIDIWMDNGKRVYYSEGEVVFDTRIHHRVELMAAILKEDELRYKEKCDGDELSTNRG